MSATNLYGQVEQLQRILVEKDGKISAMAKQNENDSNEIKNLEIALEDEKRSRGHAEAITLQVESTFKIYGIIFQ